MARHDNFRINIFFIMMLAASSLITYRLFILSYVQHDYYSRTAKAQNENVSSVLARGNIYFQDPTLEGENKTYLAAVNRKYPFVYAVPAEIKQGDLRELAHQIGFIVDDDPARIESILSSQQNSTKVIKRRLTNEQMDRIKSLKIKGVGVSFETDRFYPADNLAANLLGFLGYNGGNRSGQYGIEGFYDADLFGKEESLKATSANIFSAFRKEQAKDPATDRPADIILTIDKNVQAYAETSLKALIDKWSAQSGSVIVQEPNTGKILAIAEMPTFNPNSYSDYKPELFLNSNVQEIFEPGSTMKPITMAAGLDLKKVTPQTTFEDLGFINISGYTIRNFSDKVFGLQTMTQVLEKSINTGAMFVENLVGDDNFLNYLINLGFGQRTGIDLPGEVSGDITNLYSGRKINYLTASFGQGIAVTPIQLINAYSTIANGGKLMRPYVVEKIIKSGEEKVTQPEIIGIPLSEKTSSKLKSMLVGVVDNGFDRARIKGYDVAGKTGTAQIPDGKGAYLENEFIHNFVGFAPAYNPKFVILLKIEKPQGITFAADSLSPTFKELAEFLLQYYNIPPTRQ